MKIPTLILATRRTEEPLFGNCRLEKLHFNLVLVLSLVLFNMELELEVLFQKRVNRKGSTYGEYIRLLMQVLV